LTVITNIIVEVVKTATYNFMPTQLLALIVSEALTFSMYKACWSYYKLTAEWYHSAAAVVVGFMVAYAAMFGFDKLREIMQWGDGR